MPVPESVQLCLRVGETWGRGEWRGVGGGARRHKAAEAQITEKLCWHRQRGGRGGGGWWRSGGRQRGLSPEPPAAAPGRGATGGWCVGSRSWGPPRASPPRSPPPWAALAVHLPLNQKPNPGPAPGLRLGRGAGCRGAGAEARAPRAFSKARSALRSAVTCTLPTGAGRSRPARTSPRPCARARALLRDAADEGGGERESAPADLPRGFCSALSSGPSSRLSLRASVRPHSLPTCPLPPPQTSERSLHRPHPRVHGVGSR